MLGAAGWGRHHSPKVGTLLLDEAAMGGTPAETKDVGGRGKGPARACLRSFASFAADEASRPQRVRGLGDSAKALGYLPSPAPPGAGTLGTLRPLEMDQLSGSLSRDRRGQEASGRDWVGQPLGGHCDWPVGPPCALGDQLEAAPPTAPLCVFPQVCEGGLGDPRPLAPPSGLEG